MFPDQFLKKLGRGSWYHLKIKTFNFELLSINALNAMYPYVDNSHLQNNA